MSAKRAAQAAQTTYLTQEEAREQDDDKQIVVDRELTKLYETHKKVDEELVIDAARDPRNPLHKYFEWDDSVAAHSWRKKQALDLILASKMVAQLAEQRKQPPQVVGAESTEVRRLVNAFRGEGFVLRTDALADKEMRTALVEKYKSKLRGWCRETVDIPELQSIRDAILGELGD